MDRRTGKVVVSIKTKQAHAETKGTRDHITVDACVSASGLILRPQIYFSRPSHQVHMEEMDLMVPYTPSHLMVKWIQNFFMVSSTSSLPHKHRTSKVQNLSYLIVMAPTFQLIRSTYAEEKTYTCTACHHAPLMFSSHWMWS